MYLKFEIYIVALSPFLDWPVSMDIKAKGYAWVVITGHESQPSDLLLKCALENKRRDRLLGFPCEMVPNDMSVCFDRADSFELDHFDQYFHSISWLVVKNDTVFEAGVLDYDRYKPPLVKGHVRGALSYDKP